MTWWVRGRKKEEMGDCLIHCVETSTVLLVLTSNCSDQWFADSLQQMEGKLLNQTKQTPLVRFPFVWHVHFRTRGKALVQCCCYCSLLQYTELYKWETCNQNYHHLRAVKFFFLLLKQLVDYYSPESNGHHLIFVTFLTNKDEAKCLKLFLYSWSFVCTLHNEIEIYLVTVIVSTFIKESKR